MEARWQVGPDTARKVLRAFGIDPGGRKGALILLTDVLRCEGIADPLTTWIGATSREREILASGLLTLAQWQTHFPTDKSKHATTHYRRLKHTSLSIRIGNQHRFRPDFGMPSSPPSLHGEGRP